MGLFKQYPGNKQGQAKLKYSTSYTKYCILSWLLKPHLWYFVVFQLALQWHHNGRDSAPNHQPHHCLLNSLFRRRTKKTSKFRVTGLCAGNSPETGEFPAQMASNAENVSIWWRHHVGKRMWVVQINPIVQIPFVLFTWLQWGNVILYRWLQNWLYANWIP